MSLDSYARADDGDAVRVAKTELQLIGKIEELVVVGHFLG